MDNSNDQVRQITIQAHKHNKTNEVIDCPFCGKNNRHEHCKHLDSLREPKYKSATTGDAIGNYVYTFRRSEGAHIEVK